MQASASMPPTPQPSTPRPLIMVVCESVPTTRVGIRPSPLLIAEDHRREIFQVHLVDDAGVGRHHAEIPERRLAPAQQHVALAIALEFEQRVEVEGVRAAEMIHLHGVVDHQVGGHQRIGAARVGAHRGQGVAHGGQIHHAGHAGEILQQHARRHEADLFRTPVPSPRATASTSGGDTRLPSSLRSRFSSRMRIENGRRATLPTPCSCECGETEIVVFRSADAQLRRRAKTVFCH